MAKFKIWDKVKFVDIKNEDITGIIWLSLFWARDNLTLWNEYIIQDISEAWNLIINDSSGLIFNKNQFELVNKTLDNLEKWDIIINWELMWKILYILEPWLYITSSIKNNIWIETSSKLKSNWWEKYEEKIIEISMNDIADKFGIDVKNLKIKKD